MPHALLYVRDALELPVKPTLGVPPALSEVPKSRSGLLDPATRGEAASAWTRWWAELVAYESRRHLQNEDPDADAVHQLFSEYHRALDPETSAVLAGTALESPALALFGEGCDWGGRATAAAPRTTDLTSFGQPFAWAVVRDAAESVAAARQVDTATIEGAVSVLAVEGIWWDLVTPSFALCSAAAATDPYVAATVLRSVFHSGLTA